MGLPSRNEQIEKLVEYLMDTADLKMLLTYYRESQLDYFEGLSDKDLKEFYIDYFEVDEP